MRSYESLMEELDPTQRAAATVAGNAVIAAGAGSGKTRVLAARYAHLVVERGYSPSSILALTFTRKAAAEMYSRIHATLRDTDHPAAREAVRNFAFARIDTLDSFCNSVARAACRSYGVAPDFSIDDERAGRLADELALSFLLERRASPVISQLMRKYALADLPSRFFAGTMVRYSPITRPLDLAGTFAKQKEETARRLESVLDSAYTTFAALSSLGRGSKILDDIAEVLSNVPERPVPLDRAALARFLAFSARLAKVSLPGNPKNPALMEAKSLLSDYRTAVNAPIFALVNFVLNEDIIREAFDLLSEFQELFARKKREAGILTFTDVSRMALDALVADPALRASYKATFRSIMIDEFQDDNELQRDLLFLLAERLDRTDASKPRADELGEGKLFFVGDEKQSIYRFRGADVSVFRSLARELGSAGTKPLATNYRSEPALIESFNAIFERVFLDPVREGRDIPPFEASFERISARPASAANAESAAANADGTAGGPSSSGAPVEVLLVAMDGKAKKSPDELAPDETEAAAVAEKIRGLLDSGFRVSEKTSTRPIAADDIAVLFRTGRSQRLFESRLRDRGIPCQSETLKGLFADAPINDIYALLRLAVFPADNTAYAILLRSPFVGLGDAGFATAMLARLVEEGRTAPEPFGSDAEDSMEEADRAAFARGRALWNDIRDSVDRVPAHELVSRAWYAEGYRYLVETDPDLAPYRELYDYFFELARRSDERGETLATFLDEIAELRESEGKIDNIDIPVDRSGGVRLMTVHKSKGLEFPVVFLVDAANNGRGERNEEPVYLSREWGLSVNAGSPADAEGASGNWCYAAGRDEENAMVTAELRRLLYVAMTRARQRLFVSAVVKTTAKEDDQDGETGAPALLQALREKRDNRKGVKDLSFLDLLLPSLAGEPNDALPVTVIGPMARASRASGPASRRDAPGAETLASGNPFGGVPLADYPAGPRRRYAASALAEELAGHATPGPDEASSRADRADRNDPLSRLLSEANMSPADFGTLVHACIEARFEGREPPFVPEAVRDEANAMTSRFLESPLGALALAAGWRETEYGFLTDYPHEGRTLIVSGQADLAFESGGTVYVVDYKTDREENPERHAVQLAVYRKALGDIRKKPVQTWLFYLRTGTASLISG